MGYFRVIWWEVGGGKSFELLTVLFNLGYNVGIA
jgi:hypothetical protein